ncbi:uncharacterized protein LOC143357359 [Halictus rubicundus]|uniref:uncharacterized protein LOC143357359 n=1 Tax=Halictus rubicundus TaxID=77578 RepID=UPI004036904A
MGQAWCKEKTTKAEDSKSPLDRVFVRCAHRIYPSLKEEGSVLGGATQRVTSSEIGYAGSPPREVLTRGRSIDSVDRPFHPSDWVDVNLEVPSTPRPSSALTNLTVDTSLYPATTPTSSCSNLKESAPVPPPRRKKRNKGRPLPPKPDETAENAPANLKRSETGDEPLYSSVKSPKSSGDDEDAEEEIRPDKHRLCEDAPRDGRKTKEIYEHKVNGTGRIISSDMVSGKRSSHLLEINQNHRKPRETEEYERFARSRTSKDSSTPNREDKRWLMEPEKQIEDTSRDAEKSNGHARTKNYSTVSLPNYDELDVARHQTKGMKGQQPAGDRTKSRRPVRSSTGSLPAESFLAPFSEKTSVRLEDYIPSRCSPDNLSEELDLEKLECGGDTVVEAEFLKYDPSKSEDWELGGIGNCELSHQRRLSFEEPRRISKGNDSGEGEDEDVLDYGRKSPVYIQKPESFGKTPSPAFGEPEYSEVDPNRTHLRYFKPPTLEDSCRNSTACETSASTEPFYLDEAKHRSALDTIGVSGGKTEADRSDQPGMIFRSSLSNESEPEEDTYEPKELSGRPASLIRTISEESLPREMLEQQELENFFDEKLAKDVHNKLRKNLDRKTTTPPPSPEPRIKPELLDNDHSTLLKVLKDETAEESNLSSMTPSLNELEAALSDMLEKEEPQETVKDEAKADKLLDPGPKIDDAKVNRNPSVDVADHPVQGSTSQPAVFLGQILENRKPITSRKVSFCAWEETLLETDDRDDREFTERPTDLDKNTVSRRNEARLGDIGEDVACPTDQPPEKPSRMNRSLEDLMEDSESVPTPPRRRHRSLGKRDGEVPRNGSAVTEAYPNDRLI